jgi:hypothetical protein
MSAAVLVATDVWGQQVNEMSIATTVTVFIIKSLLVGFIAVMLGVTGFSLR